MLAMCQYHYHGSCSKALHVVKMKAATFTAVIIITSLLSVVAGSTTSDELLCWGGIDSHAHRWAPNNCTSDD